MKNTSEAEAPAINNPDVSEFDYSNLNGEAFKKYMGIIGTLKSNELYDFEQWLASSVEKFKINEDTGQQTKYLNGIKLNGNKPINYSRISLRTALELNRQVNHAASNSRYYLLKQ